MDKQALVRELQNHFQEEMKNADLSGDGARSVEARRQWTMYRMLPIRQAVSGEPIVPPVVVEMETGGIRAWFFLVPGGGGHVLRAQGQPVQVLTPQSPLGEALLGKKVGDSVEVRTASGATRLYRVVSVI